MFSCEFCGKKFSRKYNLKYHLENNKTKCYEKIPVSINNEKFECSKCHKVYTQKFNLIKHISKYHPEVKNEHHQIIIENDNTSEINYLKEKIDLLTKIIIDNKNSVNINIGTLNQQNINNIDNSINNSNNTNIEKVNVRPYSYDNDGYLTEDFLDKCVANPYEGVVKLIKHVNFHPNHPENYNMYMNNRRKKEISFFNNKKWVKRDTKSALNFILNTQTDRIGNHLDNNPEKFKHDKDFIDNILHLILDVETHDTKMKNNSHYRNMVNNIFKIIYDNNDIVLEAIKKKVIKVKNKDTEINYDTKKTEICVPLFLEPTKIID